MRTIFAAIVLMVTPCWAQFTVSLPAQVPVDKTPIELEPQLQVAL